MCTLYVHTVAVQSPCTHQSVCVCVCLFFHANMCPFGYLQTSQSTGGATSEQLRLFLTGTPFARHYCDLLVTEAAM